MNLEEALKWADDYPDNVTIPLAAEIRRLRAENARQIATLKLIIDHYDASDRQIELAEAAIAADDALREGGE